MPFYIAVKHNQTEHMSIFATIKEMFAKQSIDLDDLIKRGAKVVDVRTPEEFASGHVQGSDNIPLPEVMDHVDSFQGRPILLVCRSGARSAKATVDLKKEGIEAYNAGPWTNLKDIEL